MRLNSSQYLQKDKEANFTVLMGADYMAVLIEWLFQDNKGCGTSQRRYCQ